MRHPDVVELIRGELQRLNQSRPVTHPSSSAYAPQSLPFTHAVFLESLRLYPPIPFELKQCLRPTTLPDGTCLPSMAVVVWCAWAMNRSSLLWGGDGHPPQEFRPARWLQGNEGSRTVVTKTAFEFPVFNGGPRMCLGKKMADELAVRVIACLAEQFDFVELVEVEKGGEKKERKSRNSLTLPMEGGLPCFVKRREIR